VTTKELDDWIAKTHEEKEAVRIRAELAIAQHRAEVERVASFTPTEFAPGVFTFLVAVHPCVFCAKPTTPDLSSKTTDSDPFPIGYTMNFAAQRDRAGIQKFAYWHEPGKPVCVGCKDTAAQTFECAHCKQARALNESHESFGSPAEHLCVHCYSTVPAKQWEGLVAELEEQHRYDFE
jgi:hypothetical protein